MLKLKAHPTLKPSVRLGKDFTIDIGGVGKVVHGAKEVELAVSIREREFDFQEIVKDKDLVPGLRVA